MSSVDVTFLVLCAGFLCVMGLFYLGALLVGRHREKRRR